MSFSHYHGHPQLNIVITEWCIEEWSFCDNTSLKVTKGDIFQEMTKVTARDRLQAYLKEADKYSFRAAELNGS